METQGDVIIWVFWELQTDAIIGVKFGDTDNDTYKNDLMDKNLNRWEKQQTNNHGKRCHKQWKHFHPFVLSVDVMLGKEALVVLMNLSQLMTEKMDEPILHVQIWINGQVAIAVSRLYSCMIRGARLLSDIRYQDPD